MPKTIANLLSSVKLDHKIPNNHPLLKVPISLFYKEEYFDLLTIVWLISEEWANPKFTPTEEMILGEISKTHVEFFYKQIKNEILSFFTGKKDHQILQIKSKPNPWMTAQHVTMWINDNWIYKILIPNKQVKKASRSLQSLFSNRPKNRIADIYPSLKSFYEHLGIEIKDEPSLEYVMPIINRDLQKMHLNDDQIIDLSFYLFLFLFGHANMEIDLCNCTYADAQMVFSVKTLAQMQSITLEAYLETNFPIFRNEIASKLKQELIANNISLPPHLLGLICFENCPFLKSLFFDSWKSMSINIDETELHDLTLLETQNQFAYGELLCFKKTQNIVDCIPNDAYKIFQLINLSESNNFKSTSFFSQESNSIQNQFEQYKSEIKNADLRKSITQKTINDYELIPLINYTYATAFIFEFGITSSVQITPSEQQLNDLLVLFNSEFEGTTFDSLIASQLFIDLQDLEQLDEQSKKIEKNLSLLEQKLQQKTSKPTSLELSWINTQKMIWSRFKTIVTDKINAVDEQHSLITNHS